MYSSNAPLISIILPTYNGRKYIESALHSCANQTYENLEIIVIDDASTDGSIELINEFARKDSRVRVISNLENKKLPKSLNIGFENAKGDFLTWTSDDNLYRPEAISELLTALKLQPEYDFVYSNYTLIDKDSTPTRSVDLPPPSDMALGNVVGPSFLFSRRVFEKTGYFDPQLFLIEDYDYWMRVFKNFKILKIPKDLYLYRLHEKSLSTVHNLKLSKSLAQFRIKHFDMFFKLNSPAERYEFLAGIHRGLTGFRFILFHLVTLFVWPRFIFTYSKNRCRHFIKKILKACRL